MMKIFDLKDRQELLYEVMELELKEWGSFNNNIDEKINKKIEKYFKYYRDIDFCKLVLVDDDKLVGFISLFPYDGEKKEYYPWYATMFVKKEYRGLGYSKILNDAILEEARNRGFKEIYLKTELKNYYEKFGAKYVDKFNDTEIILKFEL